MWRLSPVAVQLSPLSVGRIAIESSHAEGEPSVVLRSLGNGNTGKTKIECHSSP